MAVRSYSFREGDRSEYLAQFLLSALGLCSPIPRQEDVGFDFACSIADQEDGLITFGYPYLISIKSASRPSIKIKPTKTTIKENDNTKMVAGIFPGQPAFLGVVNKRLITLKVFSLLPLWFLYYKDGPTIGSLSLNPRLKANQNGDVGAPIRGAELQEWLGHYHYDIDLGHPIAQIDTSTLKKKETLAVVKAKLRMAVDFAERTIVQSRLDIPFFYWFAKTTFDSSAMWPAFGNHWIPHCEGTPRIMANLVPSLICFAGYFRNAGNKELFEACVKLIKFAPPGSVPEAVLQELPELRT